MKSLAEQLLDSKGLKPTPQRVVITQFVLETESHPTAEEVFLAVENSLPVALSRATVYNTLNALVKAGVVREMYTDPAAARYDANLTEHHHFIDVKTGRILDVPKEMVPELTQHLGKNFKVHNYQVTFYGEVEE
ncbi:MAG: transcriptional repressor [Candidatus Obscuribacterales bacterium]